MPVLSGTGVSQVEVAVAGFAGSFLYAISGALPAMRAAADGELYDRGRVGAVAYKTETASAVGGEVCQLAASGNGRRRYAEGRR
jgi:hypothetical protein